MAVLDQLFWSSPHTLRYGTAENLYGHDAIRAFRAARLARELLKYLITSFGRDFATVNCEFRRKGNAAAGCQSQTWMGMSEGWRVVSAC